MMAYYRINAEYAHIFSAAFVLLALDSHSSVGLWLSVLKCELRDVDSVSVHYTVLALCANRCTRV